MDASTPRFSLNHGRLCIGLGAILWSLNAPFTKFLTQDTFLKLNEPPVHAYQIAFFRVLFAGLVLLPTVRRRDVCLKPAMIPMVIAFAVMNLMFISATAWGSAANAILLQYTAPMWIYVACIWLLGESADRRSTLALLLSLAGIGIIVFGGSQRAETLVIALGLGSGVTFATVVIGLRALRGVSSSWLTVLNHLCAAVVILPTLFFVTINNLSISQMILLFVFGSVQMGLPYLLVARGLRVVSPQEAGIITLLEPLLNPIWAYLVSPTTETPSTYTLIGGGCILGALVWRYWPWRLMRR